MTFSQKVTDNLAALRRVVARPKSSIQLALLGVLAGLVAAMLIIMFRLVVLIGQSGFVSEYDNFTQLPETERLILPILAAVFIATFAYLTGFKHYRLGIPYVIHRIKQNYGQMPIWNAVNQFVGGAIALISGFSVGREGPSVHMGAAGASVIASYLHLPFNAMRTLTGCGVAAGISASFNTPLAAVIFVMEVVLREYKVHIFVPVILASVTGAITTQFVFGSDSELALIQVVSIPPWHYPYLVVCGIVLGAVAYGFNKNLMLIIRTFKSVNMFPRLILAGIITGAIGYLVPQAMGSGMSAIDIAVSSPEQVQLLTTILIAKLLATLFALGLGIPGGIIGPVIGLGVILGSLMSYFAAFISPEVNITGTYAVLGMAGLLAATLNAPLAALMTVMELTASHSIIVPAMLVIVSAYLTALQGFGNRSIFLQQLDFQGLKYQVSPAVEALQKVGVIEEMSDKFNLLYSDDKSLIAESLDAADAQTPLIVFDDENGYRLAEYDLNLTAEESVSIRYVEMQGVTSQATLGDAFEILRDNRSGVIYVYDQLKDNDILGIIRWDDIRQILMIRNALL
ncbi:chloride channel protein [Pseudoalteromonas sp. MMG024]|uniref:chloride channel protein n=1 Tax=Pseudoalteromonas sp. MMG024 TaxID=2909980 RepID=UPI001F00DE7E|nr:chloride channel protein [Pseudoalteromonas sp. MMG024]MCF6456878.1 chloride channel protein [Pseudoalteromonas sp. MMG024]